jgi:hypothetical protein
MTGPKIAGERALSAGDWVSLLLLAGIGKEKFEGTMSKAARRTIAGNVLTAHLQREVTVEVKGVVMRATLHCLTGRANSKKYFFAVRKGEAMPGKTEVGVGQATTTLKPKVTIKPKVTVPTITAKPTITPKPTIKVMPKVTGKHKVTIRPKQPSVSPHQGPDDGDAHHGGVDDQ